MEIELSNSKDIKFEKINELFNTIGWKSRTRQRWHNALSKSSLVVSAWDNENLVGLGRILEDGVMCMCYDIGVHPEYQRKGIGLKIMNILIDFVKDKGFVSIGLFTWEENEANIAFYEKLGFERVATGMELVKYMIRE